MEFQMWKDYLQLALVIQNMAREEISEPPPLRDLLLRPAERLEIGRNEQNNCILLNFPLASFLGRPMDYPYLDWNNNVTPTHIYGQGHSYLQCDEAFQAVTPPNSVPNNGHGQPNSLQNVSSSHGATSPGLMCSFCRHNGESKHIYKGHNLKDEQGRVTCPILRAYSCALCGATGDKSHTKKYCPRNKDKHCLYNTGGRNSAGRKAKG